MNEALRSLAGWVVAWAALAAGTATPTWAGSTPYGIVARSKGYTCEIAMSDGPTTVRIAAVDIPHLTRVLIEVKDCDKYGWISLYDGPARETIQVGFGCTPMLIHMWWHGTLPDGHGTISWTKGAPGGGQPPAQGPGGALLHYDFTRPISGVVVSDLSGNGRDGVLHEVSWAEGKGAYFRRGSSSIQAPGDGLHAATGVTITGDVTPWSISPKPFWNLFWKGNLPDCTLNCENREYSLWMHVSGTLNSGATPLDRVGVGQLELVTPPKTVTGTFSYALVLDSNAGTSRIYVNGRPMAAGPWSRAGIRQTTGPLLIGGSPIQGQNTSFHGIMRSFRIFGRALSEAEVGSLAIPGTPPAARLTAAGLYRPDDVVLRGMWAGVVDLTSDMHVPSASLSRLEPGVAIEGGLSLTPGADGPTEAVYRHDGSPATLSGLATVLDCAGDGSCGSSGSCDFIVKGDGRTLWQSGVIRQPAPGKGFSVSLAGVRELRLVTTDGGDGTAQDWAAWLNLRLTP